MNVPLFRTSLRSNWLLLVIIFAIMLMYMVIIVAMYEPDNMEAIEGMLAALPEPVAQMMGFDGLIADLISFLATYYYSFLVFLFPMIYVVLAANRMIAKHVDSGSMAYLLATPHTRVTIAATQGVYLLVSTAVLLLAVMLSGLLLSIVMFPGTLDVGAYVRLNVSALLVFAALSGICFFFSCLFDESRYATAAGGGVALLFFVFNMLANFGDQFQWLRYLSLFSLLNTAELLTGWSYLLRSGLLLLAIAVAAYGAGLAVFSRRSLVL